MSEKDGGFAFPFTPMNLGSQIGQTQPGERFVVSKGMTLRDWFAGQALAGIMGTSFRMLDDRLNVEKAYSVADAMLAVRAEGDRS